MDAVASELRGMDAAYERCVKKAVIYSDKKTLWAIFFWFRFLYSYKENELAARAKHQVNIYQRVTTSADELKHSRNLHDKI